MSFSKQDSFRRFGAVEASGLFALIMWYIWRLRFEFPGTWLLLLAAVAVSHSKRNETLRDLGFRLDTLREAFRAYGPILFGAAAAIIGVGVALHTAKSPTGNDVILGVFYYFWWGLFQQYLLNAYFVNRMAETFPETTVPLFAAGLFALAHSPNWFLMLVTFAGGYFCARAYLSIRNLYFLGFAHGLIGFALWVVVPEFVSRHFYVGPKWFHP
jgi:hypothetical protein